MRLQVLGPVSVSTDAGEHVRLRPQTRRLAALLLVADGHPVPLDHIGDVLGMTHTDGSGVRMAMSRLRGIVGERLETAPSGYRLVPGDGELDARTFETGLRAARASGSSGRLEHLQAALALWRGDAYGEFAAESWATTAAVRLEQARLGAVEDLADALIECDRPGDAAELLHAHADALCYRERAASLLMEALAASGRVTEALRVYQRFRSSLIEDIGIEPTESLHRLEADLLADGGATRSRRRSGHRRAPRAGNLVDPPTSFVGRVRDLTEVVADLGTHRLVSLVGPGGVGKTRLAIAAARTMALSFPDGLWFVDLAPLRSADAVAPAAASTLEAVADDEVHLLDSIAERMRDRSALVIVDNCEHVLAGAVKVVGALASSCPNVRVLVTTREPLGVPGECVHAVSPLDMDDSVELFRVRTEEANRQSKRVGFDHESIAQICRRVDRLPLSIELAAMRMRSATPAEMLERLDHLDLDESRSRGRPDHQRTMRAMVEWSYRLLSVEEQALFDRLSVFAGSFDREAAAAVAELEPIAPGATDALLDALVDRSMVLADVGGRTTRYRLLDTMRHFGHDQIVDRGASDGSGELDALVARHRRHYESVARTVSRLFLQDTSQAIELLDEHWDNWRIALSRALDAGKVSTAARIVAYLWPTMTTFRAEIATWVAAVRERMTDDDPAAPWIYTAAAQWSLVLGDFTRAIDIASRGIELGLSPTRSSLWNIIAEAETMRGNAAAGFAAAVEALGGCEGDDAEGTILATACRCAWAFEPSRVRPWAERLCAVAAANGRADDRARAAHAMGVASLVDDDPATALAWFNEGREAARGLRGLEAEALQGVARATALLDRDGADAAFLEALTALYEDRNRMYAWVALENLMLHWFACGRTDDAAVLVGHLEAYGRASSVNAAHRQQAVEVVRAERRLDLFRQRGATMSPVEMLELAIGRLADPVAEQGVRRSPSGVDRPPELVP